MIVIRLTRVGKTKAPSYRIVVQEKQRDPWGKTLEYVGNYNARTNPKTVELKAERILAWIANGAKASPAVHNILVNAKIVTADKAKASHNKPKAKKKK